MNCAANQYPSLFNIVMPFWMMKPWALETSAVGGFG
jgi:hypothetical protein